MSDQTVPDEVLDWKEALLASQTTAGQVMLEGSTVQYLQEVMEEAYDHIEKLGFYAQAATSLVADFHNKTPEEAEKFIAAVCDMVIEEREHDQHV